MTEIIFARHGKTDNNDLGVLQGHLDAPLNEGGLRDAEELAEHLSKIEFDVLISSDLQRAKDCAKKISEKTGKRIFIEPLIKERFMGVHQGVKITNIGYNDLSYDEMVRHLYECDCPGGESNEGVIERIRMFLRKVFSKDGGRRVVVATHGGVIMLALNHIFGEEIKVGNAKRHKNGHVSYLKFDDARCVVDSLVAVPVRELVDYLKSQ